MLILSLSLLTLLAMGAQCNATSTETPLGFTLQISHASNQLGLINEQIATTDALYLSMVNGERVKIYWNSTLVWAVSYGGIGYSMALSTDSSFLIAGSYFGGYGYLGKLNSADGTVMASYSSTGGYYNYIYLMDEGVLCINSYAQFKLLNATSFILLSSGGISGQAIWTGSVFNDTHVVLATGNAHILMMENSKTLSWQQ